MTYPPSGPTTLHGLLERLKYKDGWRFELAGGWGVHNYATRDPYASRNYLRIWVDVIDSLHGKGLEVCHQIVTPDGYLTDRWDEKRWRRWLLDCIIKVETHEACEFFTLGDDKPFFPAHGPDGDPYVIRERDTT